MEPWPVWRCLTGDRRNGQHLPRLSFCAYCLNEPVLNRTSTLPSFLADSERGRQGGRDWIGEHSRTPDEVAIPRSGAADTKSAVSSVDQVHELSETITEYLQLTCRRP
jgi:hypothetical protein